MKKILIIVTLFFLSGVSAHADITIKIYKELRTKKSDSIKIYVGGVAEGFDWANSALENKAQPPLYCVPPKLPITNDGYLAILDNSLEEPVGKAMQEYIPIAAILLKALERTFPCSK